MSTDRLSPQPAAGENSIAVDGPPQASPTPNSGVDRLSPGGARGRDTLITCRNSQGVEIRATPLRLSRYEAVFEVYNPYSILQLSEVLSDFRITIGERIVYAGRAVVSKLVNASIMVICEVSLESDWLDVEALSPLADPEWLRREFAAFLTDWSKIQTVSPAFKAAVADMETFLADLRRWLDQVELGIRSHPSHEVEKMEREVMGRLSGTVLDPINELFGRFEELAKSIAPDHHPIHRTYARRQLHPLVLCAPFPHRTFQKPLGYAGDYEMVNMILNDPFEGASLFAKSVNYWFLMQAPAAAHRNRIEYLIETLGREVQRLAGAGRRARIFNLGCGPAAEVQRFLKTQSLSDAADFTLVDFNEDTLNFARHRLAEIQSQTKRTTDFQFIQQSVHQVLKRSARGEKPSAEYDLVYCAGLFDYLSDRICQRLMQYFYEMLAPGGLLISTNVDPSNPNRHGMEYLLEWHLNYRDESVMRTLHPTAARPDCITTKADATGVNIYLEVRRPERD